MDKWDERESLYIKYGGTSSIFRYALEDAVIDNRGGKLPYICRKEH